MVGGGAILIVAAGDAKIDNSKYKAEFGTKAKMLTPDEASELVGHAVGGVCPFAVNDGVKVYLDEALKRFETVYPACGSSNSAIELTIEELAKKMSCNPAHILNLEGGSIAVGAPADLTAVDLTEKWTIDPKEFVSKGKNTPFTGREVYGRVKYTVVDGDVKYREK